MYQSHDELYNTPEDILSVKEKLKNSQDVPPFKSYTIRGNEDCPMEIRLYAIEEPNYRDEFVTFQLVKDTSNYIRVH
jgi:hypothetical protein